MRLTQERIIQIISLASDYQDQLLNIRKRLIPELEFLASKSSNDDTTISLLNLASFVASLTEIEIETIKILAEERAHFNSTRIKHNEYARASYYKRKAREKLLKNPLDLPISKVGGSESQNNADHKGRQNNVAATTTGEVPLLAQIEAEERLLNSPNLES